jgi:YVTN family beta-propeller protein
MFTFVKIVMKWGDMGFGIRAKRAGSLLGVALVAAGFPLAVGSKAASVQRAASAIATISFPNTVVQGVAVNPDTDTAYVSGVVSHLTWTVSVVDLATSTVTATVAVGAVPGAMAVDPVTNTVYVANRSGHSISVIDGATNTVTATIPLATTGFPNAVAVDTATDTVYAAISGSSPGVAVINGTTNSVVTTIAGPSAPNAAGIAYDQAAGTVYAAFSSYPCCSKILVLDPATNSVTKTIALSGSPLAITVDPGTGALYVSDASGMLRAYSTATDTLTGTWPALYANSLADNPHTHTVYAAFEYGSSEYAGLVNSPATRFTSAVPVPGPGWLAVDAATDTLVSASVVGPNSTVSVIPLRAPRITSRASATLTAGELVNFFFTASGTPAQPKISETGKLPAGTWLTSVGELTGTPNPGSGGIYPITITAANGVAPAGTQRFTLIVDQAPAITSASHAAFTHGRHSSFTVRTTAFPAASVTEHGALPPGLRFTAGKNGTATISGTPARSARGKTYLIRMTARNGVGAAATQRFSLRVSLAACCDAGIWAALAGMIGVLCPPGICYVY